MSEPFVETNPGRESRARHHNFTLASIISAGALLIIAAFFLTQPWEVSAAGLLLCSLLAGCLHLNHRRQYKIETIMARQTETANRLHLAANVLDKAPDGMIITDKVLKIVSVNQAFTTTTGYSEQEALGQRPNMLSSGRHDKAFYQAMWLSLEKTGQWQGEIWNRRKNGEIYPEWLNITAIPNEQGEITHYAGIFSDLSAQEHLWQRLHRLAYYDVLTGLPNRDLFMDRLNNALTGGRRQNSSVALLFLDLDRFKTINETLGHTLGDSLLKAVADRLSRCIRESDTIARLGGDEFTIVLNGLNHPSEAAKVAKTISHHLKEPFTLNQQELFISASTGISLFPGDGDDPETLLKNADTAMYRAKESGRNRYQFYETDMSTRFAERLSLENELRRALENDELQLAYQPKVELASGRIIGMEALARWQHKERGWISPATFIPIAEEAGLMLPIGEWVLRTACRQAKAWQNSGHQNFRIAVNLSGHQIQRGNLLQSVKQILAETALDSHYLELELTESILMENAKSITDILNSLQKMGIQLAVDDFGTGYSSLGYLKSFALDTLKIDKSFVDDMATDKSDAEIVATIIAMGRNLNLKVVAEGVETQQQLELLHQQGCDEIQGYLFSKPVTAGEMAQMLEDRVTLQLPAAPLTTETQSPIEGKVGVKSPHLCAAGSKRP